MVEEETLSFTMSENTTMVWNLFIYFSEEPLLES